MDISSIAVHDTAEMVVLHPITKKDTDIKIRLYSPESNEYRAKVNEISKRSKSKDVSAEDIVSFGIELLASCTVSWENMQENGKDTECNKENALRIYTDLPWLRKQVDAFIGKEVNFLEQLPSS